MNMELFRKLAESHRPVRKLMEEVTWMEQWLVQCPACDGNSWRIWRDGDKEYMCALWRDWLTYEGTLSESAS